MEKNKDTIRPVSNEEIYHRIKEVSDISVNVFMLEAPDYSTYRREKQDIFPDSKVYIKGEIADSNYTFEFSAKTPKKEVSITWLLNLIKKDYVQMKKNHAKWFGGEYDKSNEAELISKVFKFKMGYGWYYVTEYGIGTEVLFMPKSMEAVIREELGNFLEAEGVAFTNEYSDANWVLRFKISRDYEFHNELLEKFKNQDLKGQKDLSQKIADTKQLKQKASDLKDEFIVQLKQILT